MPASPTVYLRSAECLRGPALMSYRGFKRLLGENSLERKCRFLLGGFILLLVTGSFWLYASQTEYLADRKSVV